MMTLAAYLKAYGVSQADFAAAIGVKQPTVHRWTKGEKPSLDVAAKIHNETGGLVPVSVWVQSQIIPPLKFPALIKRGGASRAFQGQSKECLTSGEAQ